MKIGPDKNCKHCKFYTDFEYSTYYCTEPTIGNLYTCPCENDTFYCRYDSRDKTPPYVESYYDEDEDGTQ